MDAPKGLLMAAVIASIAILASVLVPTFAFLMIALVSLKDSQPADRPAILRALAAMLRSHHQRFPKRPGARSWPATRR